MDVGSANAASSTSSTATATVNSASAASKTTQTHGKSFDEEMKSAQSQDVEQTANNQEQAQNNNVKEENKTAEKQEEKIPAKEKNSEMADLETEASKSDILSMNIRQLLDTQNQLLNRSEIFNLHVDKTVDLTQNIGETLDFNTVNMTENDAMFFVNIIENNQAGLQNVAVDIQQALEFGTETVQKSATVSKTLLAALQNTVKTGQAVRIDFGNDIAVIMRVSKDGSIMANFIPGDKAVEQYLKNNIDFLRQRFDEENIPYSQLSYSQQQQQRERQQQNKEDRQ